MAARNSKDIGGVDVTNLRPRQQFLNVAKLPLDDCQWVMRHWHSLQIRQFKEYKELFKTVSNDVYLSGKTITPGAKFCPY